MSLEQSSDSNQSPVEQWRRIHGFTHSLRPVTSQGIEDLWYLNTLLVLGSAWVMSVGALVIASHDWNNGMVASSVVRSAMGVETGLDIQPLPTHQPGTRSEQVLLANPTLISQFQQQVAVLEDKQILESLNLYIEDGVKFRRKILYSQVTGLQPEANMDATSYGFWGKLLGLEFSEKGLEKIVGEYQVGDKVVVNDYKDPPGIVLRKTPKLETTYPSLAFFGAPFTYNGDSLEIVDGPEILLDDKNQEAWEMFEVQQVRWHGRTLGWQPTGWHPEGWMWSGWFERHSLYEPDYR